MLRLLVWTARLWLTLIVIVVTVHFLSISTSQPSSILSDYQCTPQPCWHGIYPETTSIAQAETILRSDTSLTIDERHTDRSSGRLCWLNPSSTEEGGCLFQGNIAATVPESPFRNGPLTFGEAITLFGTPTGVKVCYDMINDYRLFVVLYFQGSILVSNNLFYISQATSRINLDTAIAVINYHVNPVADISPWKGFVPLSNIRSC